MRTTEATYAAYLHEWLYLQAERHLPYLRVKAPGRGRELPFDCRAACFRCTAEVS